MLKGLKNKDKVKKDTKKENKKEETQDKKEQEDLDVEESTDLVDMNEYTHFYLDWKKKRQPNQNQLREKIINTCLRRRRLMFLTLNWQKKKRKSQLSLSSRLLTPLMKSWKLNSKWRTLNTNFWVWLMKNLTKNN